MKDIECIHVNLKKYKDRSLYIYNINNKQDIILCPDCNMILAGEIMKQMAIETFLDIPSNLNKINIEEVKDVRKRRTKKGRRKKSKD